MILSFHAGSPGVKTLYLENDRWKYGEGTLPRPFTVEISSNLRRWSVEVKGNHDTGNLTLSTVLLLDMNSGLPIAEQKLP